MSQRRIRIAILCKGGELAEWMGYLRSRIRLMRSVAVYLPVATIGALLSVSGATPDRILVP